MMKKSLWVSAAMLLMSHSVWAQKQWTLKECVDYAMQNNITLKKARLSAESAQEDVKGAQGALWPTLSASTNQSVGYRPWQDNGTTTVTNGQVNTKINKSYYNGSYGLNASWTLWNGNKKTNTVRLNKLSAEQAPLETEVTANSIQEQIAQLYVQILYLTDAVKVSEKSLETSRKNEERGKEMLEVGKMSKADLAQLSAQRASDEYTIIETRANIAKYKLQLKQLLELDGTTPFDVSVPETTDEQALATIPALQDVYQEATIKRPEIQSKMLAVKSSELNVKIAKAGYYPTLNLTGGIGTSTNSLSNKEWGDQLKTNVDASAGLQVSIPIFDGRQTRTSVGKARISQQQALLNWQDQQKELYQTIEQYWLDAETNQQKFRTALVTEQSEMQSFELLQEQFDLGLKNIIELMTAPIGSAEQVAVEIPDNPRPANAGVLS